jgi:hypothetical protein
MLSPSAQSIRKAVPCSLNDMACRIAKSGSRGHLLSSLFAWEMLLLLCQRRCAGGFARHHLLRSMSELAPVVIRIADRRSRRAEPHTTGRFTFERRMIRTCHM